ncbi:MAG TPA: ABC transporter permease [Actinomycetota bacterium]|nr:ABC transporter permease [Actinomycetota bacterium]
MAERGTVTARAGAPSRPARGRRPSPGPLLLRQIRHQNLLFWRNPFSAFFTMLFPLVFLLLFNTLQGSERLASRGGIRFAQFLTPGILAFAVVSACYTNLATSVPINRDEGILKRVRGTPLPPWVYVAARIGSAVWMALIASVLMIAVGVALFHFRVYWHLLPAAAVTLVLGAACFCACGLAVASVIPNGEAAPAVANFTVLPVIFVSDIFYPLDKAPTWLKVAGSLFPVKHFALAIEQDFSPFTAGLGFRWDHLAVVAAWLVVATLVAVRKFRWEPSADTSGGGRTRGRGRRAAG